MPIYPHFTEQNLPPWLQEIYRNMAEHAHRLSREEPPAYREERLARIPPALLEAHRLSTPGLHEPYLERANAVLGRANTSFPENYQYYMNPYQDAVVRRIAEEGERSYKENILPAIEAHFLKLGQHGSSRHQREARRAAKEVHSEIMAKQAQALERGYQQAAQIYNADKARQLETAHELASLGPTMQASRLADIAMLGERGRYEQQQEQAKRDIAYQDYLRSIARPMEMLERQAALMSGLPSPSQQTVSYQATPGTPQLNVLGQLGSLAGNVLGARLATARKRGGHIKVRN